MSNSLFSKICAQEICSKERIIQIFKEHLRDPKYKTEMCKNWEKTNSCRYNEKCRFAHGKYELLSKDINSKNYKEKDCLNFYSKGFCNYGLRCCYRHEQREIAEIIKNKKIYFGLLKCSRLPVFLEITAANEETCTYNRDSAPEPFCLKSIPKKEISLNSTINDDDYHSTNDVQLEKFDTSEEET